MTTHHPADNAFLPVVVGTIAWAVALVITWLLREQIGGRWAATCAVAVICGLGGIAYLRWRRWRIARAQE